MLTKWSYHTSHDYLVCRKLLFSIFVDDSCPEIAYSISVGFIQSVSVSHIYSIITLARHKVKWQQHVCYANTLYCFFLAKNVITECMCIGTWHVKYEYMLIDKNSVSSASHSHLNSYQLVAHSICTECLKTVLLLMQFPKWVRDQICVLTRAYRFELLLVFIKSSLWWLWFYDYPSQLMTI